MKRAHSVFRGAQPASCLRKAKKRCSLSTFLLCQISPNRWIGIQNIAIMKQIASEKHVANSAQEAFPEIVELKRNSAVAIRNFMVFFLDADT